MATLFTSHNFPLPLGFFRPIPAYYFWSSSSNLRDPKLDAFLPLAELHSQSSGYKES